MSKFKDQEILGVFSFIAILTLIWLFQSFLLVLLFASIFAISTYPIFTFLNTGLSKNLSAFLMCLASFLFVILPLVYLFLVSGFALSRELPNLISEIKSVDLNAILIKIQSHLQSFPLLSEWFNNKPQNLSQYANEIKSLIVYSGENLLRLSSLLIGSLTSLISLGLFLFILFFFYKDAHQIVIKVKFLLPTSSVMSEKIIHLFKALCTIYLINVLVLAIVQGFGFAVVVSFFDLPPAYLGLLFALSSFIPIVGTLLIWLPLVTYLFFMDQLHAAIWITIYSLIVSGGLIDYWFRAKIVDFLSKKFPDQNIQQSSLIVILSTLAGVIEFGVLGLIFGPLLACSALGLIHFYLESKTPQFKI